MAQVARIVHEQRKVHRSYQIHFSDGSLAALDVVEMAKPDAFVEASNGSRARPPRPNGRRGGESGRPTGGEPVAAGGADAVGLVSGQAGRYGR